MTTTTAPLDRPASVSEAEWAEIVDALTRRQLLTGGAALAVLGLGAAYSGQDEADASPAGWRFTDDLGRTVRLGSRPARIASLGDGLTASLWSVGVHSVAAYLSLPADRSTLVAGGVPLHGDVVPIAGANGDVDLEALAKAEPDLIVTTTYGRQLSNVGQSEIFKIAPVVGLNTTVALGTAMASITRLAHALRVRLTDMAAEKRYDVAAARLRAALAAKPGLRITWVQDNGTSLVVLYPKWSPFTLTLAGLGAQFSPSSGGSADVPGKTVSWELVPTLPADLVLVNGSSSGPPTNPAWKAMPAVKAGQFLVFDYEWYTQTFTNYAGLVDRVTTAVEHARPGVGPASRGAQR